MNSKKKFPENKYIYLSTIYLIWKNGASLLEEKYFSSDKPIKPKKNVLKKKGYIIQRFFEPIYTPNLNN